MPTAPTKLQRWLDVVAYLASRRLPVSTEELWKAVPAYADGVDGTDKRKRATRRMFERDKDELRALGIPIETVQYAINYGMEEIAAYRIAKKDFHLPYLKLLREAGDGAQDGARSSGSTETSPAPASPNPHTFEITEREAGAALDGLRELSGMPGFPLARSARSAFRKLAFDLEPDAVAETPIVYADDPETVATKELLATLSDAVRRRKALAFRYRAMTSGDEDARRAHGFGLMFQHGRWYLAAHDLDRDAMRLFRVGRMSALAVESKLPGTPDYEVPHDFTLDDYAGRSAWELGAAEDEPGTEIAVRFRFPRSLWAERNDHGELVEEDDDGAQLRRFAVHRPEPFLRWVLSLAGDARVESPDDLRDAFRALAGRVVALHADDEEAPT